MQRTASLQSRDVVRKILVCIATLIAGVGLSLHPNAAAQRSTQRHWPQQRAAPVGHVRHHPRRPGSRQARTALAAACPPAPAPKPACAARSRAVVGDSARSERSRRSTSRSCKPRRRAAIAVGRALDDAGAPQRAEAWFYLAGAYAPLAQWRVLRGRAARGRARRQADQGRARARARARSDAAGRLLRHRPVSLLRGRRAGGASRCCAGCCCCPAAIANRDLREMLQARERGALLRGEADYQLHWLYLWYEHAAGARARPAAGLDARYPVQSDLPPAHRRSRSATTFTTIAQRGSWQTLLDRATRGTASRGDAAAAREIGHARTRSHRSSSLAPIDALIDLLRRASAMRHTAPYRASARAISRSESRTSDLAIANARSTAAHRAIAIAPSDDPDAFARVRATASRDAIER